MKKVLLLSLISFIWLSHANSDYLDHCNLLQEGQTEKVDSAVEDCSKSSNKSVDSECGSRGDNGDSQNSVLWALDKLDEAIHSGNQEEIVSAMKLVSSIIEEGSVDRSQDTIIDNIPKDISAFCGGFIIGTMITYGIFS